MSVTGCPYALNATQRFLLYRTCRTIVEGARDYVRHTAVRRSGQVTTHYHGEANHLAWLERPFNEALRALDERGRE